MKKETTYPSNYHYHQHYASAASHSRVFESVFCQIGWWIKWVHPRAFNILQHIDELLTFIFFILLLPCCPSCSTLIALVIVTGHVQSSKHLKKNCHGDMSCCAILGCIKLWECCNFWNCKLIPSNFGKQSIILAFDFCNMTPEVKH